jgi:hypothetical protein
VVVVVVVVVDVEEKTYAQIRRDEKTMREPVWRYQRSQKDHQKEEEEL